jgi:putative NADH-flavin reductase
VAETDQVNEDNTPINARDIFDQLAKLSAEDGIDITDVVNDQDAICPGIGRVTMESAHLERVAQSLLAALLGGGQVQVLIVGQSFSMIHQAIKSLLRRFPTTPPYDEANRLIDRANQLYRQRSHVVHGDWVVVVSCEWQGNLSTQYRRFADPTERRWTSDELGALADDIDGVAMSIMELTRRMGFPAPGPLPLLDDEMLGEAPE